MNLQKLLLTKNACYKAGQKIKPKGVMVHSTGADNPNLRRYVGPDDGKLGVNEYGNHWNQAHPGGSEVCVHAFIGKLKDGSIATYQTLPWNYRGWHAGGSANDTHIGFEICEDDLTDSAYFKAVYKEAVEFCAYLCKLHGFTEKDIICHSEGYKKGVASNHSDVMHWFPKHGKSMDTLRADVKKLLAGSKDKAPEADSTLCRVVVGDYKTKDSASATLKKVKAKGFDAIVIKSGNSYKVQLGVFRSKANAAALRGDAKAKGFSASVTTKSGEAVSSSATTTSKPKTIKVGSKVRLKDGARTYTGGWLASFVYNRVHKVSELKGERAVITYDGTVVAAVHVSDLILV